jgi:hypothetical protein
MMADAEVYARPTHLDLACKHAPGVKINGMTATEVLAHHRERHPDGNCRGS